MDLILNGEPKAIDASDCANLAELVAAAERVDTDENACVVVSVEVDGVVIDPEEMSALEGRSLEGIEQVVIERRETLDVARSVLDQGADYTKRIEAAIEQTVDHYRSARSDLANNMLADVIDSMTVLTGITYSVANVLAERAQALADLQGEIFPWLEELMQAQTEEDPIRIADTLEYEVSPRILEWGTTMRTLGQACEAQLGGDPAAFSN